MVSEAKPVFVSGTCPLTPIATQPGNSRYFAGSLEAAYSLNWGAREIWGKGGGETLALL